MVLGLSVSLLALVTLSLGFMCHQFLCRESALAKQQRYYVQLNDQDQQSSLYLPSNLPFLTILLLQSSRSAPGPWTPRAAWPGRTWTRAVG